MVTIIAIEDCRRLENPDRRERPAVLPVVTDAKPVKDGVPVVQPGQKLELNEQQRAAVQAYADAYKADPHSARDEFRRMRELIPEQASREVAARIKDGQPVSTAISELQVRGKPEGVADVVRGKPDVPVVAEVRQKPEAAVTVPVPAKDNLVGNNLPGRDPLKAGIQMEGERPPRQFIEAQIAALKAQQQQLDGSNPGQRRDIQAEIAALKAQVHQQPGERGEFRDGRGGPLDAKQLQEIAQRQQRDVPLTPGMEAKIKASPNPDALAIFNQSWKDGKDRDGRGGELGLRGRPDAGDQLARASMRRKAAKIKKAFLDLTLMIKLRASF